MTVDHAKYIRSHVIDQTTLLHLDHPEDPGYIDGEYTGNGKHILFLIQSKKDLQEARKHLRSTTYYDRWTNEYYKEVVGEEKMIVGYF